MSGERQYYFERFTPQILMASAFGPLLMPSMGVRLDQLLLYALLPIAIGLFCVGRRSIISQTSFLAILSIFVFIAIWTLIITLGGVPDHIVETHRTTLDELAAFENSLHTLALIIVLGVVVDIKKGPKINKLLDRLGSILILFMCLNAIIAISTIFYGPFPLAKYFIPGYSGSGSTAFEVVAEKGRFSGIFDFPAVAGTAYSIALLMWTYLTRKSRTNVIRNYLVGGTLIIGGMLTISKIFIIGGIPLFIIYWFLPGRVSSRMTLKLVVVLVSAILAVVVLIELWAGLSYIQHFVESDYGVLELFIHFLTIRYGTTDDALFGGIVTYIWSVSPVQGMGLAYLGVADSAYILYFMEGGMVALSLYVAFVGFVIFLGVEGWLRGHEIGRLLTMLGVFILMAGVGAPIITMPRVGVMLWIILILGLAVKAELNFSGTQHVASGRRIGSTGQ